MNYKWVTKSASPSFLLLWAVEGRSTFVSNQADSMNLRVSLVSHLLTDILLSVDSPRIKSVYDAHTKGLGLLNLS